MVYKILAPLLLMSSSVFAEERTFNVPGFQELNLKSPSGDVEVQTRTGTEIKITFTKKDPSLFDKNCTLNFNQTGKKIFIKAEKILSRTVNGETCQITFQLLIPEGSELDLTLGHGNLNAKGTYSEIEVKLGKGDLQVNGSLRKRNADLGLGKAILAKRIDKASVRVGSGDIDLKLTEGRKVDIRNGSGEVKVSFEKLVEHSELEIKIGNGNLSLNAPKLSQRGKIEVHSGKGNVDLALDAKASIKILHSSGFGKLTNELETSDKSKFLVHVKNGFGDLSIKKISTP